MSALALSLKTSHSQEMFASPPALGTDARSLAKIEQRMRAMPGVRLAPPFDALSDEAVRAVVGRWNRPCEGAFELLALRFPKDLASVIQTSGLGIADLTFAAEALGRSHLSHLVRSTLVPLLGHPSAIVREGAIYGLQRHLDLELRIELEGLAAADSSPAVRAAAEDSLADP